MSTSLRPLTYQDLRDLPDDGNRYELIDGELVVLPSPPLSHQALVVRLLLLIHGYLVRHDLGDLVFPSPVDVRLGSDLRIVQPDVVYVSPERRHLVADPALIDGAPDLVVEVLSPSRPSYDRQTKRRLYAEAGVLEFWLADPQRKTLAILVLRDAAYDEEPIVAGRARSVVLPGLEVDLAALFADLP